MRENKEEMLPWKDTGQLHRGGQSYPIAWWWPVGSSTDPRHGCGPEDVVGEHRDEVLPLEG